MADGLGSFVSGFANTFVPAYQQERVNKSRRTAWDEYSKQLGNIRGQQGVTPTQPTTPAPTPTQPVAPQPSNPIAGAPSNTGAYMPTPPIVNSVPKQENYQNPYGFQGYNPNGSFVNSYMKAMIPFWYGG